VRGIKIFIYDSEAGRTREERYTASPIKIGRHPRNDLNLNFGFVSSWHAEVDFDGRGGSFRDIGSTNGSVVEGRRVEPQARVALREGLVITIGRLEIRFAFEDVEQDSPALESKPPPGPGPGASHGGPTRSPRNPTMPIPVVPDDDAPAPLGGPPPVNRMTASAPPLNPQGPPRMPSQPPSMQPLPAQQPQPQGPPNLQGPPPLRPNTGMQGPPSLLPDGPPSMLPNQGPPRLDQAPPPLQEPSAATEPPKPKVSGAEATGFVDLGGVHRAMRELRPAYEQFANARKLFQDQVDEALGKLPANTRDVALAFFRREFPEMPGATPFAAPTTAPSGGMESSTSVERFAVALLGNVAAPKTVDEQAAFLARVAEILQTSAQAFIEIRNVQSRFGEEMGVRTIREYTPLHGAADARGVLDYLLDWRRGGPERNAQLSAVYSDFMLHQVALINGVVEGVQGLLDQFRPQEIERGVGGLNKAGSAWKKYAERYAEMIEERGIAALVFGPEFARAYSEVGGNS
jgi:hypothetical protein